MEKDTKYRKYLEGLKKATKKESFLERRMELASPKAYMKSIGVFPKVSDEPFLKKRIDLGGVKSFLKIPKIGKIMGAAAAIGAAGSYVGKKAYDKLKDKDKKMGGGMMYKYKSGGLSPKQKKIARMAPPPDKITGDDFKAMKTMKAKSGAMVYVKTKIGKNKPTKIC
jgi:hypothetical protein